MKPGIYYDLSFEQYQAIPAANKSGLDHFERSPLHYWAAYLDPEREPEKETPAKRLGSAIHVAILEPKRYEEKYRIKPEPEQFPGALVTVDDYKEHCRKLGLPVGGKKDELKARILAATPPDETPAKFFDDIEAEYVKCSYKLLSSKEARVVDQIASRVRRSDAIRALGPGKTEVTIVWVDPETGLLCKGRIDWLSDDWSVLMDLKSTADGSPEAFAKSALNFTYYRQAPWYLDGVTLATGMDIADRAFVFATYETKAPFAPAYYYATDAMLKHGRVENRDLLTRFAACWRSNSWPGYAQDFQPLNLPDWATRNRVDPEAKPELEIL
jgi:hypothetical protein